MTWKHSEEDGHLFGVTGSYLNDLDEVNFQAQSKQKLNHKLIPVKCYLEHCSTQATSGIRLY